MAFVLGQPSHFGKIFFRKTLFINVLAKKTTPRFVMAFDHKKKLRLRRKS
jgi:hypothetical protein